MTGDATSATAAAVVVAIYYILIWPCGDLKETFLMGASLSASGSFHFVGVPPSVLQGLCLEIEGRTGFMDRDHLLEVKPIRDVTPPVRAGACWHEVVRVRGGHVVEIRKVVTYLHRQDDRLHLRFTIEVVGGPSFIPRFHGTYSLMVSGVDDDPRSSWMEWTNAFVPSSCAAYVPAVFFRRYMVRTLQEEEQQANRRLHVAALKKIAEAAEEEASRQEQTTPIFPRPLEPKSIQHIQQISTSTRDSTITEPSQEEDDKNNDPI
jgi:hypothetical protein